MSLQYATDVHGLGKPLHEAQLKLYRGSLCLRISVKNLDNINYIITQANSIPRGQILAKSA